MGLPCAYRDLPNPKWRHYGKGLKIQIMAECQLSGSSTVGVVLAHGTTVNIIH